MELIRAIEKYRPWNQQEQQDQAELLRRLKRVNLCLAGRTAPPISRPPPGW